MDVGEEWDDEKGYLFYPRIMENQTTYPDLINFDEFSLNFTNSSSSCDINNSTVNRDPYLAKFEIATLAIIFALILMGNSIVLIGIFIRKQKISRMYYFIIHLTMADLITGFFNVLPQLCWEMTFRFKGGNFMCKFIKFGQLLGPYSSSYVLVMTAIDRYQAICYPLLNCSWTARRSKLMLFWAWALSFIFCIPQLFIFSFQVVDPKSPCIYDCWGKFPVWLDIDWEKFYITFYALAVFLIPLKILIFCYCAICKAIWVNINMKNASKSVEIESEKRNRYSDSHSHDIQDDNETECLEGVSENIEMMKITDIPLTSSIKKSERVGKKGSSSKNVLLAIPSPSCSTASASSSRVQITPSKKKSNIHLSTASSVSGGGVRYTGSKNSFMSESEDEDEEEENKNIRENRENCESGPDGKSLLMENQGLEILPNGVRYNNSSPVCITTESTKCKKKKITRYKWLNDHSQQFFRVSKDGKLSDSRNQEDSSLRRSDDCDEECDSELIENIRTDGRLNIGVKSRSQSQRQRSTVNISLKNGRESKKEQRGKSLRLHIPDFKRSGSGSSQQKQKETALRTMPRAHSSKISRAKIKTVKLTVTVILCYILCSSPFIIATLWASFDPNAKESPFYISAVFTILTLLSSLNSCVNPFIFLFFNPNLLQNCWKGSKDISKGRFKMSSSRKYRHSTSTFVTNVI